jgi:hypothetical protein
VIHRPALPDTVRARSLLQFDPDRFPNGQQPHRVALPMMVGWMGMIKQPGAGRA